MDDWRLQMDSNEGIPLMVQTKMKSPYSRIPFLKWDGNVVLWDGNVILCTLGRGHIMVIEWWFKIVNCKSLRGT